MKPIEIQQNNMKAEKEIQGLFSPKDSTSFWSLKAKVDLAEFRETKNKGEKAE
jgi:hypothetical protein